MSVVLATILVRGDTAANWTAANPVLNICELGVETDTLKFKLGNGVTAWNSLGYAIAPTVSIAGISGTKSEYNTSLSDGDFVFTSDVAELAQDAVGAMVDATLEYVDGTPLLRRAAITGDGSIAAGSNALTLATVNSNTGTFGGAATSAQISVNGKGLITGVTAVTISIPFSQLTSVPTTLAGHNITLTSGNVTTALGYTPIDPASFGSGVATALGVNVGLAGAFVVNGGAGGTPSSLTLTNATGLPTAGLVNDAVTYAKMQNISATRQLLGRSSAGAGDPEEIAWSTVLAARGEPTMPLVRVDDFMFSGAETGEIGEWGWNFANGTVTGAAAEANHPGVYLFNSSATIGQLCQFYPGYSALGQPLDLSNLDFSYFIFKENAASIADLDMRLGFFSRIDIVPDTAGAVWGLFLEKLAADSNWFLVGKNGGGNRTRTDTGVAAGTTAWLNVKLRRHSATEGRVSINGAAEVAVTSNAPLGAGNLAQPAVLLIPTAANSRSIKMDLVSVQTSALTR